MTQQAVVLDVDLEHKAFKWGDWSGMDMARRQSRQQVVHYFDEAEILMNAQVSARNNAVEYGVSESDKAAFMQVFIDAYSAAYREQVEICKCIEAERRAKIVRK